MLTTVQDICEEDADLVLLLQQGLQRQGRSAAVPQLGQLQLYHFPSLASHLLHQAVVHQGSGSDAKAVTTQGESAHNFECKRMSNTESQCTQGLDCPIAAMFVPCGATDSVDLNLQRRVADKYWRLLKLHSFC